MKVAPVLTAQRSVGPLWLAKADDSGDGKSGHARLLKAHRQLRAAKKKSGVPGGTPLRIHKIFRRAI